MRLSNNTKAKFFAVIRQHPGILRTRKMKVIERGSIPQETRTKTVSQISSSTIFQLETQAGHTSYQSICFNNISICPACTVRGAEIDLSVVDGKHNRTGRRQARGSGIRAGCGFESHAPHSGAIPTLPGAGYNGRRRFYYTHHLSSCAHFCYWR
jgi:hypothetical protein